MALSHGFVKDDAAKEEFILYARFAIYDVPPDDPLAGFGVIGLGRWVVTGQKVPWSDLPGLHDITMTLRKNGVPRTLMPPDAVHPARCGKTGPSTRQEAPLTCHRYCCVGEAF
ncbi:MAG: hypothetical protein V2I76_12340 [Roseobacter sp.]|jgi:hypothetical protein|nr:hypothetical protein [Roseobacter sp.]